MSKKAALIEMETLNQLTIINKWVNECSSRHLAINNGLREVRGLISILLEKQQTITIDIVVKEARNVDLSGIESWGSKSK